MLLLLSLLVATAPDGGSGGAADAWAPIVDGGTVVLGSRSKDLIGNSILAAQSRISACDESAQTEARAQGKVSVKFTILPSGDVGAAQVSADTINRSSLTACIISEVMRFKFPKPNGGGKVFVTYPFIFPASPDGGTSLRAP